jgi:hypothetical protein
VNPSGCRISCFRVAAAGLARSAHVVAAVLTLIAFDHTVVQPVSFTADFCTFSFSSLEDGAAGLIFLFASSRLASPRLRVVVCVFVCVFVCVVVVVVVEGVVVVEVVEVVVSLLVS